MPGGSEGPQRFDIRGSAAIHTFETLLALLAVGVALAVAAQRLRVPLPADALAGGADVFYSPDFTLPPLARARAAVTVHDLSYLIHPETHYPPLRRYLEAAVPRALDRLAAPPRDAWRLCLFGDAGRPPNVSAGRAGSPPP